MGWVNLLEDHAKKIEKNCFLFFWIGGGGGVTGRAFISKISSDQTGI